MERWLKIHDPQHGPFLKGKISNKTCPFSILDPGLDKERLRDNVTGQEVPFAVPLGIGGSVYVCLCMLTLCTQQKDPSLALMTIYHPLKGVKTTMAHVAICQPDTTTFPCSCVLDETIRKVVGQCPTDRQD